MAERSTGERRTEFIARAKVAFKAGVSQAQFLRQAIKEGYSYRRTVMLGDFRSVSQIEKKTELFKYVRKDYKPTAASIAQVEWEMSQEFMYKVKVSSRISPDDPITDRFVNIMHDRPLTPREVEGLVWEMIGEQSPKLASQVISVTPWTAVQRIT